MTKLLKLKKLIKFLKEKGYEYKTSNYVIKGDKVYLATWDTDPHHGRIEDYEEKELKEADVNPSLLSSFEDDVAEILLAEEARNKEKKILKKFYLSK
jgi:hypothetical protein